ncbi:MAG: hypothetical protein ACJ0NC_05160 [Candidatus Marivariicella sp.]
MKNIYYKIAVGLTILNLFEVAIRKFSDFTSIIPNSVKIVSITAALICFGIHFYKNKKYYSINK